MPEFRKGDIVQLIPGYDVWCYPPKGHNVILLLNHQRLTVLEVNGDKIKAAASNNATVTISSKLVEVVKEG